ncbi:MAG: hypothetical protein JW852_06110 [Spirochaetales bacterium]|nr:hypothetical protein [Spirochaetales bacterium]
MDRSVTPREILKTLQQRGAHPSLSSPGLTALKAFLSGVLLIRIIANYGIIASLWARGTAIDFEQIAATHAIIITAYIVWVSALSSYNIRLVIPRRSFVDLAPGGRRFISRLRARSLLARPANWVAMFVLCLLTGCGAAASWYVLVAVLMSGMGTFAVLAVAERLELRRGESELIQVTLLTIIVWLNPDISSRGGFVITRSTQFGAIDLPLMSFLAAGAILTALILLLITLWKTKVALTSAGEKSHLIHPVWNWYWRAVRLRFWILTYTVVLPIIFSPYLLQGRKGRAITVVVVAAMLYYLVFLSRCDNELRLKWRISMLRPFHPSRFGATAAVHSLLALAPAAVYLFLHWATGL